MISDSLILTSQAAGVHASGAQSFHYEHRDDHAPGLSESFDRRRGHGALDVPQQLREMGEVR